ncbi:hypothetical protein TRICI_005467 [Trichomonascus ciferrii]|uniref:Zinc finger CHCC-type domain-containing protein n=1 Tax=Trichomonascus ciferrii TaxID=44093 RepID=A0A642UZ14_9ASCO|nr:hypothetical protein TRICI_005467 [Trichomonascus ciferrii]
MDQLVVGILQRICNSLSLTQGLIVFWHDDGGGWELTNQKTTILDCMWEIRYIPRRLYSSVSNDHTPTIPEVKDTSDLEPADYELKKQAPNREHTWAPSQKPRSDAQVGPRFEQRDLARQPRPYAAIELIAKEPVRYQDHSNVAVCDGGRGAQGHPKIFINLDKPGAHACLYCKSHI